MGIENMVMGGYKYDGTLDPGCTRYYKIFPVTARRQGFLDVGCAKGFSGNVICVLKGLMLTV